MKVLYSFNKRGEEAAFWTKEIAAASDDEIQFIPFNHDPYLDTSRYLRAQLLDELYYARDAALMRLYADVQARLLEERIEILLVDNCPPYHPDWLRGIDAYKVLRTSDGPICAYDRDFAYVHAYDHVLYHSPAYSRELDMEQKLRYVGARRVDFWPLGLFDAAAPASSAESLFSAPRDIDVVFVGAFHLGKMPFLAKIKKALGRRCVLHGLTSLKRNLYFNCRYGFPGWITPLSQAQYLSLYRRAKIGFNVHNRGKYTVGGFRLFELPANGVMQISDGDEYLDRFFKVGDEVIGYAEADELIEKIRYYLRDDAERTRVAKAGYQRVMADYRFGQSLRRVAKGLMHNRARVEHTA